MPFFSPASDFLYLRPGNRCLGGTGEGYGLGARVSLIQITESFSVMNIRPSQEQRKEISTLYIVLSISTSVVGHTER